MEGSETQMDVEVENGAESYEQLSAPLFESLAEFAKEYNVTFQPESADVADELLNIINTGVIQEKDMTDYRHLECLAFYYQKVKEDYQKAAEYFKKAIDSGSPHSIHSIAYLYYRHIKDYDMAKKYFKISISQGFKVAVINCAYMCAQQFPVEYDSAIKTLEDIAHNVDEPSDYRIKAMTSLFTIYYKRNQGKDAIRYIIMSADMGDVESMSAIYRLINEYDPVIYDDEVFPNAVEESEKYITKALAMQSPTAFELYFKFKVDRANTWINKHKKCIIPQDILDSLVEYGRQNPDHIARLDTPVTQQAWTYVACKLGIPCNTNVAVRMVKHGKQAVCDICMSDSEKLCIPVNWCMHYACVDCFWLLDGKPCPFCRCE